MLWTAIFCLLPFICICHGKTEPITILWVGATDCEGISLPLPGEDHLNSFDICDMTNEYPLPGELVGSAGVSIGYNDDGDFFPLMVCGGFSVGIHAITDNCFAWFGPFWADVPNLLWPVSFPGYTKFVDSKGEEFFWIAGGHTGPDLSLLDSSQVFQKEHSTGDFVWTVGVDLPMPLYGQCMVQLNVSHVLITGGDQSGGGKNMVFDWENKIFSNVGDFVGGERYLHGCAKMADGRVMVTSGYRGATGTGFNLDTVEIFDPVTESWSEGPKLGAAVQGSVLLEVNYGAWTGHVLHIGGLVPDPLNDELLIEVDTIYRYRIEDNEWELLPYTLATPRSYFNVIPIVFEEK